jgi:hypothetical protein
LIADIGVNLSELESAEVSVEALDSLLLSESVSIENKDGLLWFILKLSPGCRDLLKHIAIIFLSANGLSLLGTDFRIPQFVGVTSKPENS